MRVPSYRLHKATGQAFIELAGKRHYLGKHGTTDSKAQYEALLADWLASKQNRVVSGSRFVPVQVVEAPDESITVNAMLDAFAEYAQTYYRRADGTLTTEPANIVTAVKPLRELYGNTAAPAFTPKDFKRMRERMIALGWSRSNINRQCARVKLCFKWAASEDMVPASVWHGLTAVSGLKRGRCNCAESKPVRPAPVEDVQAVKPHVSRQVWAMIQLQLFTGMRPGEVVSMRLRDLKTKGQVWTYTPESHKTAHHGHKRTVYIGPRAQAVLRKFITGRKTDELLFTPEGNFRHRDGDVYTASSYRVHIRRACKAAGVSIWHPHQLRHNAATNIRAEFGIEAAQHVLGHRTMAVTAIYAERDGRKAAEVMAKVG